MKTVGGDGTLGVRDICLVKCHERSRLVEYSGNLLDIDRLRAISIQEGDEASDNKQ